MRRLFPFPGGEVRGEEARQLRDFRDKLQVDMKTWGGGVSLDVPEVYFDI